MEENTYLLLDTLLHRLRKSTVADSCWPDSLYSHYYDVLRERKWAVIDVGRIRFHPVKEDLFGYSPPHFRHPHLEEELARREKTGDPQIRTLTLRRADPAAEVEWGMCAATDEGGRDALSQGKCQRKDYSRLLSYYWHQRDG